MKKILISLIACSFGTLSVFSQNQWGHVIPSEKGLTDEFNKNLYLNERTVYKGEELKTIGMPCGGIASGQLYVRGDGSLACWWIANNAYNTGYGISHLINFNTKMGPWKVCYQTFEPFSYIDQFFEITVESKKGKQTRTLNNKGFDAIEFTGEYPIAEVKYKDSQSSFPVSVSMDVFSPFIPMKLRESATPATVLKFKVKNVQNKTVTVSLKGVLQNMVMRDLRESVAGKSHNVVFSDTRGIGVNYDFQPVDSKFENHPYNGNMSLFLVGEGVADSNTASEAIDQESLSKQTAQGNKLNGSVTSTFKLKKGEEKEVVYLLSWYFPNRPMNYGDGGNWDQPIPTAGPIIGNMYSNWFDSSQDVVSYLSDNFKELSENTYLFRDTWYNQSNLPYWLRHRLMMPVSTLATETCQWWANNKFWSWEGVGSCVGTCTHVWNYAQAQAYLFPELERNVREFTDFGTSFMGDGAVATRNGWGGVHLDGHAGAILKLYREHLLSKNSIFLSRHWDKAKRAMDYLIARDTNVNGLLEGDQPNTYDISFNGPNTYVGALYLAALRAAEEMALLMGDQQYAEKCRKIFESGKKLSEERLWNGLYFKQDVDLTKFPNNQYANGCLSDQLFGQTWSHILNLGYLYDESKVKKAINSIWTFNWAPDVGEHNKKYVPERVYASPGESGLLNCTYPISKHLDKSAVRYRNEVWTGIEYQVATNMIYEGKIDEALTIVHAIHDRYNPKKHNPWNEIECGDHYARALASWGVLIALENYHYDGPKGILSFNPQVNKNDFSAFFSSAEGWGLIKQSKSSKENINTISLKYGTLSLTEIQVPATNTTGKPVLKLNGKEIPVKDYIKENDKLTVRFPKTDLKANDIMLVIQ